MRSSPCHSLMSFSLYDELRATLSSSVLSDTVNTQGGCAVLDRGTQTGRFDLLMAVQGKDEIRALALYLDKGLDLRS